MNYPVNNKTLSQYGLHVLWTNAFSRQRTCFLNKCFYQIAYIYLEAIVNVIPGEVRNQSDNSVITSWLLKMLSMSYFRYMITTSSWTVGNITHNCRLWGENSDMKFHTTFFFLLVVSLMILQVVSLWCLFVFFNDLYIDIDMHVQRHRNR